MRSKSLKISVESWKPPHESTNPAVTPVLTLKITYNQNVSSAWEPHSQGFTAAIAKILHFSYFKVLVCGWKRNQWTPDFSSHQHHPARPHGQVSATSWWTFSAVSQTSLAFQRRENSAFGSACGKCNLTYQKKTHCTAKCRFSPELLSLEGGKIKYSIIKLSPEEKQVTQNILGQQLFLHWPWKPRKKRHLEDLVAKPFLVRLFLVSLLPAF